MLRLLVKRVTRLIFYLLAFFTHTQLIFFSAMGKLLHASIKPKVVYERNALMAGNCVPRDDEKRGRIFTCAKSTGACENAILWPIHLILCQEAPKNHFRADTRRAD